MFDMPFVRQPVGFDEMMPPAWHPAYSGHWSRPAASNFGPAPRAPRAASPLHPAARATSPLDTQQRAASHSTDPRLTLVNGPDHAYRAVLELPSSSHFHSTLEDVSAEVDKPNRTLAVRGVVVSTPRVQEFMVTTRSAVYATPSRAHVVGVAPAGMCVVGSRCTQNPAWVELDEGYIPSSALRALNGSQPTARRFVKEVVLPEDANLDQAAVSSPHDDAVFEVRVPRRRVVPAAAKKEPAPQAAAQKAAQPAPQKATQPAPQNAAQAAPKKAATDAQPKTTSDELLRASQPVLCECPASLENVQMPVECTEEWQATPSGGFSRLPTTC
ncbi:hypothetical protein AB1Y20_017377 [Prymnesium parvum]|uniref:Uncharacterized protein n=1 Tax=Prymnesium parvum TaxID=97485 RepID=A0AB34JMA7_PRYPA